MLDNGKSRRFAASALAVSGALLAISAPAAGAALAGHWAGDRLAIDATPTAIHLTLDCAAGSIDAPLLPDRAGHFTARGNFNSFQPGPQRADEPVIDTAAHFTGAIKGNRMALSMARDGKPSEKFALVRGAKVKPARCL